MFFSFGVAVWFYVFFWFGSEVGLISKSLSFVSSCPSCYSLFFNIFSFLFFQPFVLIIYLEMFFSFFFYILICSIFSIGFCTDHPFSKPSNRWLRRRSQRRRGGPRWQSGGQRRHLSKCLDVRCVFKFDHF